jgi:hypothetical protein
MRDSDTVARVLASSEPPGGKIQKLANLVRGLELIFEHRDLWSWRLGPETWAEIKISGPVGDLEIEAFLHYAITLRKTLPQPPAEPAQPDSDRPSDSAAGQAAPEEGKGR